MTCRAAGDREAGVYECRDVEGLARDSVIVNVARPTQHTRGISLSHLATPVLLVYTQWDRITWGPRGPGFLKDLMAAAKHLV